MMSGQVATDFYPVPDVISFAPITDETISYRSRYTGRNSSRDTNDKASLLQVTCRVRTSTVERGREAEEEFIAKRGATLLADNFQILIDLYLENKI